MKKYKRKIKLKAPQWKETEKYKLLTTEEAAKHLGLSVPSLRNYRQKKIGPRFIRIKGEKSCMYDPKDLNDWWQARQDKPFKRKRLGSARRTVSASETHFTIVKGPEEDQSFNDTHLTPLLDDLAALIARYEKKVFKDKNVLSIFNVLFSQLVSIYHVIRKLEEKIK